MSAVVRYKTTRTDNLIEGAAGILETDGSVIDVSGMTGGTNFVTFGADGDMGATVGATMTADPAADAEDGFITIIVAGVARQIPYYDE